MGYKALIVDDNTVNATVISGLLKKFHVESEMALSGMEAVSREDLTQFHIVFTDYMMPDMDGIEVGRRIGEITSRQGRETPVVLCTANVGAAGLAADVETGISYILKKPVKLEELEEILRRYVDSHISVDNSQTMEKTSSLNIPGLDTAFAIRQAGDVGIYLNILREYHKTISKTCKRIHQYEQNNDTKNYRIEVHGLKTSSRLIGAMELANLCEFLENETKSKRPSDLKKQTEYLLGIYESFLDKLAPFVKQENCQKERQFIAKEKAQEKLENIKLLLGEYDLDAAEEILQELQKYQLNEQYEQCVNKLAECIDAIDYQGGIKAVENCQL